ncbi:hypothetical protein V6N13_009105 [Hibiscus sabdariffa]
MRMGLETGSASILGLNLTHSLSRNAWKIMLMRSYSLCVFLSCRGRYLGRFSFFCLGGFWVFGPELHQYNFSLLESVASCELLYQPRLIILGRNPESIRKLATISIFV